jgi:cation transport regulator ChaB
MRDGGPMDSLVLIGIVACLVSLSLIMAWDDLKDKERRRQRLESNRLRRKY